jgi:hypothetical protein
MRAKLFIKGLKDPFPITPKTAGIAEKFMADEKISYDTSFSIPGVWTGKKADMRFVHWEKDENRYEEKKIEPMKHEDAVQFENEINDCKPESLEKVGKDYYAKFFWMQSKGAVSLDCFTTAGGSRTFTLRIKNIDLYIWCQDQIESFEKYLSRRKFAEDKKFEEMEKKVGEELDNW